jgi:hypothetical protein
VEGLQVERLEPRYPRPGRSIMLPSTRVTQLVWISAAIARRLMSARAMPSRDTRPRLKASLATRVRAIALPDQAVVVAAVAVRGSCRGAPADQVPRVGKVAGPAIADLFFAIISALCR